MSIASALYALKQRSAGAELTSIKNLVVLINKLEQCLSRFILRIHGDLAKIEVFRQEEVISACRSIRDPIQWGAKRARSDVFDPAAFGNVRDRRVVHVRA